MSDPRDPPGNYIPAEITKIIGYSWVPDGRCILWTETTNAEKLMLIFNLVELDKAVVQIITENLQPGEKKKFVAINGGKV